MRIKSILVLLLLVGLSLSNYGGCGISDLDTSGGSSGLPALVSLISPLDGETGVPITPTLSWNISAGATSYNVYFGTLSTPPFVLTTTGTTHVPGTLLYNTKYYWQINSENDFGVVTGTIWTFQTKPNTAPVLVSPGDKTVREGENLTFTLSATDADVDTMVYSAVGMPTGALLISSTGVFNWTPNYTQSGSYVVTFTATANGLFDSKTVTITVNNVDGTFIMDTGTLLYNTFEFGFWVIIGDSGNVYDIHSWPWPLNINQVSGKRVWFKAFCPNGVACFHMWGIITYVLEIEEIIR